MRFLVILLALMLAALGVAGCSPSNALADVRAQGPVVPTRALPSPTPTATATANPTATPEPTDMPTATPTQEASPTAHMTAEVTELPSTPADITTTPTVAGFSVAGNLRIGNTLQGTITTQQPMVFYTYQGVAGQAVDISMTRDSGDLDAFMVVLDAAGRELARNDDTSVASTNAIIRGLTLPEDGDYLIVASRYGQRFGLSVGDFTLRVSLHNATEPASGTFAETTEYGELRAGTINNAQFEHIYTFQAQAGDLLSMTAAATAGNLDTALTVSDNLGNVLARNDDDIGNASTDAALRQMLIPADGMYSVIVSRFQGPRGTTAGDFRFKLTLEETGADEGGRLRYAVLNPLQSGTIRDDGSVYTDYYVGDRLDDDNEERAYQVLLTFALPENDGNAQIDVAHFMPASCSIRGSGLGSNALVIYDDPFGNVSETEELASPGASARELGRLSECLPLEITDAVERAYQRGDDSLQLRLAMPSAPQNGEIDAVGLSEPRLSLLFEEPPGG